MADRTEDSLQRAIETLAAANFRDVQRRGYHFLRNDYYSPVNDCDFLEANRDLWATPAEVPHIDWNVSEQLDVVRDISRFVEELREIPLEPLRQGDFHWNNPFWNNADAIVQYGLLRSRQPARVIEVGCGYSSLLMARALERNGRPCHVTLVEPNPNPVVFSHLPRHWTVLQTILQRVPEELFGTLEPGDLLFYDGSHCVKTASDVVWFFFRVLPRLAPGVLIHLHDVFLPSSYPEPWIFERGQTWNEQYLLQAFLMHNSAYAITIANRYLWIHYRQTLERLYRGVQPAHGCSFWMTKR